jgi:hypothetical protein
MTIERAPDAPSVQACLEAFGSGAKSSNTAGYQLFVDACRLVCAPIPNSSWTPAGARCSLAWFFTHKFRQAVGMQLVSLPPYVTGSLLDALLTPEGQGMAQNAAMHAQQWEGYQDKVAEAAVDSAFLQAGLSRPPAKQREALLAACTHGTRGQAAALFATPDCLFRAGGADQQQLPQQQLAAVLLRTCMLGVCSKLQQPAPTDSSKTTHECLFADAPPVGASDEEGLVQAAAHDLWAQQQQQLLHQLQVLQQQQLDSLVAVSRQQQQGQLACCQQRWVLRRG